MDRGIFICSSTFLVVHAQKTKHRIMIYCLYILTIGWVHINWHGVSNVITNYTYGWISRAFQERVVNLCGVFSIAIVKSA